VILCSMRSSNASAKKITKRSSRERSSSGSMIYSLGMSGGTGKKTRKASKSLRRTAIKNSSPRRPAVKKSPRIKGKRVSKQIVRKKSRTKKPAGDVIANAERTQVADKEKNGASQAREMMQLKQQLAAAEEKLTKSQANEMTLVDIVGELEDENAELLKVQQSKRSDSGELLADAKKYIAELKKQLSDALNASYEYEQLRANDQNDISELKRQLADARCENYEYELQTRLVDALNARDEHEDLHVDDQNDISELKRQLADALATIEELKADIKTKKEKLEKSQVPEYDPILKKIEQLGEQKSNDSPAGSPSKLLSITKNFFRNASDRHRQHVQYE